jgi:hypothetical protein
MQALNPYLGSIAGFGRQYQLMGTEGTEAPMRRQRRDYGSGLAFTVETAVCMYLSQLDRMGCEPDAWESWHLLNALLALGRGNYRRAEQFTAAASLPEGERIDRAARQTTQRLQGKEGVSLKMLQAIFQSVHAAGHSSNAVH